MKISTSKSEGEVLSRKRADYPVWVTDELVLQVEGFKYPWPWISGSKWMDRWMDIESRISVMLYIYLMLDKYYMLHRSR